MRVKRLRLYVREVFQFYGNATFRKVDLALISHYWFNNPFTVSRRFHERRGDAVIHAYGETPLEAVQAIAKRCQLSASDCVFDLGSGRGRACFWLNCFVGCKVVGIELNPYFVSVAQQLVEKFKLEGISFQLENILSADLSEATQVFIYGTLYDEAFMNTLVRRLGHLPKNTQIITVSYPLSDFTKLPLFETVDSFELPFLHGMTTVYVQKVR